LFEAQHIVDAIKAEIASNNIWLFQTNGSVNAAGALDFDFKIGVIARSRSTLGSVVLPRSSGHDGDSMLLVRSRKTQSH